MIKLGFLLVEYFLTVLCRDEVFADDTGALVLRGIDHIAFFVYVVTPAEGFLIVEELLVFHTLGEYGGIVFDEGGEIVFAGNFLAAGLDDGPAEALGIAGGDVCVFEVG